MARTMILRPPGTPESWEGIWPELFKGGGASKGIWPEAFFRVWNCGSFEELLPSRGNA